MSGSIGMSAKIALILSAGASTRMGTCKASLPWKGTTLLNYQVQQWQLADVMPVVVLGPHNADLQQTLTCRCLINPNPSAGKTSSILTGLRSLSDWSVLAIAAVDQPRPAAIYQRLLREHLHHSALITAPTHHERIGHPLLFAAALLPDLLAISEETQGLRQIVQADPTRIHRVDFESAIVLADLNTPDAFEAWRSH